MGDVWRESSSMRLGGKVAGQVHEVLGLEHETVVFAEKVLALLVDAGHMVALDSFICFFTHKDIHGHLVNHEATLQPGPSFGTSSNESLRDIILLRQLKSVSDRVVLAPVPVP